ncbi:MAG: DUF126 domain-containing protein [Pseudomonadota bacterium]
MTIAAKSLVPGRASGPLLVLDVPLSLWGGVDLADGRIVDRTHPQAGACIAGHVLAMPAARGSSSSSSALVELARAGRAPAAIILTQRDPILVVGAIVADDLYGIAIPIVTIAMADWPDLRPGTQLTVDAASASACCRVG